MTDLVPVERDHLAECEQVIETARGEFVAAASGALRKIRDDRLYRETHATFEDYCDQRWGLSKTHVNRLIQAADVAQALTPIGVTPTESQARELAPLREEPETMREVWREANERTEGRPTAAIIREIREERQPPSRDLADVLEERMPGTRVDLARSALRARWSRAMASMAEADLLDFEEVRAVIDPAEVRLAVSTLRGIADRLAKAEPGLRIVGGTSE